MTNSCLACQGRLQDWFYRGGYMFLKCPKCNSCTYRPLPTPKEIVSHYKSKYESGNYLLLREYSSQYVDIYRDIAKELINASGSLKGHKVLDIGCFTGEFLEVIERSGAIGFGTELQKEALAIARKKFPDRVNRAKVNSFNLPKGKFQAVTLLGLIEHVTGPNKLIKLVYEKLRMGGVIVFQTPDSGSLVAKLIGKWWPPLAPIEHIFLFSSAGLSRLLKRHGFKEINVAPHVKWLPVSYVYKQFHNFGPHFAKILSPLDSLLNRLDFKLPFYAGEIIVTAKKC